MKYFEKRAASFKSTRKLLKFLKQKKILVIRDEGKTSSALMTHKNIFRIKKHKIHIDRADNPRDTLFHEAGHAMGRRAFGKKGIASRAHLNSKGSDLNSILREMEANKNATTLLRAFKASPKDIATYKKNLSPGLATYKNSLVFNDPSIGKRIFKSINKKKFKNVDDSFTKAWG